jgi:hypothetical protein
MSLMLKLFLISSLTFERSIVHLSGKFKYDFCIIVPHWSQEQLLRTYESALSTSNLVLTSG